MSRRVRIFLAFMILLGLWQGMALFIQNDIILPRPVHVLMTMLTQLREPLFYSAVIHTLIRICGGFLFAFFAALCFSFVTYFYPVFADLCYPFLLLTRSIPNISYILIVLFWCSPQTSVIVISFLILFPALYATLYQGLCDVPQGYHDLMKIYPGSKCFDVFYVYLPFLRPYLFSSTSAGLSLALKVGIMAEILGQSAIGIGRQLNICRSNLDMGGVFAWTLWIICILSLLDRIISQLQKLAMWEKK